MSSLTEEQLLGVMAYVDGELEAREAREIEALLEQSAEAREIVASMRALGDGVRSAQPAAAAIDVTSAVMGKLVPNDLDRARLKRDAKRRITTVVGLVAAAAIALLLIRPTPGDVATSLHVDPSVEPSVTAPASAAIVEPSAAPLAVAATVTGVQVNSVDSQNPASIFYADDPDNAAAPKSVVVWIQDPSGAEL